MTVSPSLASSASGLLVLGPDETALDAGCPSGQHDKHAAARDLVGIVGMTLGVDALDLGFKLPEIASTSSGSSSAPSYSDDRRSYSSCAAA
jgi:hypothetical protein